MWPAFRAVSLTTRKIFVVGGWMSGGSAVSFPEGRRSFCNRKTPRVNKSGSREAGRGNHNFSSALQKRHRL